MQSSQNECKFSQNPLKFVVNFAPRNSGANQFETNSATKVDGTSLCKTVLSSELQRTTQTTQYRKQMRPLAVTEML